MGLTSKATDLVVSSVPNYYEFLPAAYPGGTNFIPTIINFESSGTNGDGTTGATGIQKLLQEGMGVEIQAGGFNITFPFNSTTTEFCILTPQTTTDWTETTIEYFINFVMGNYAGVYDPQMLYIVASDKAANALLQFLMANPLLGEQLAGVVIISTSLPATLGTTWLGNTITNAQGIANIVASKIPIWFFHNASDPTAASSFSSNWVTALNAAGMTPAPKLSLLTQSIHDAWTAATNLTYSF